MTQKTNLDLSHSLYQILKKLGVSEFVVCAGARNIPLVHQLEKTDFNIYSYFEERSASFFALGRSKATEKPVALITTSGTAVAELLPAVIEAYYQNIPMIIISADRPKNYRNTGAPQAIYQPGIFSCYVEKVYDWDVYQQDLSIEVSLSKPIHFNICFDEPLIDNFADQAVREKIDIRIKELPDLIDLNQIKSEKKWINPLLLIGEIPIKNRDSIKNIIVDNQLVHYAEALSSFKNCPELASFQIKNLDFFSKKINQFGFDSVIRIGGIPTHRLWRDLEGKYKNLPVLSITHREFSGLSRLSEKISFEKINTIQFEYTNKFNRSYLFQKDLEIQSQKSKILEKLENSELNLIKLLSEVIGNQPLYLGNSLPIREWDLVSDFPQESQKIYGHRGANGIDGQISGYLGWSADFDFPSWCVVGDLTALYDLASLGITAQFQSSKRVVVINNSGGQIFNRIFGDKKYLNSQNVDFSGWAKLWKWDYLCITKALDVRLLNELADQNVIIEIRPDCAQSDQFWQEWDNI